MIDPLVTHSEEQESRFVDFIAIILRHRTWVLGSASLGAFITIAIFFVLPLVGVRLVGERMIALQAVVRVAVIPAAAQSTLSIDVSELIQAQASNLRSVAEIYRATLMSAREETLERPTFNRVVWTFLNKSFRAIPDNRNATVLLTLKVTENNQEKGTEFLNQFVTRVRSDLKSQTSEQIERAVSDLELTGKGTSELASQLRAPYEIAAKALKSVLANPDFPLTLVGGVDAMDDDAGPSKGLFALAFMLGALALGVLLALLAEAINRTRRDPATVELLRNAWKRK